MGTYILEVTYMRKVIVATLALSPLLLHAQANSPAQPQSFSNASIVQSQLAQPTELGSAAGPDRTNTASLTDARVSTGIISPKLISSVDVSTEGDLISNLPNFEREAVVDLVVDESGKPSDLKIVKSVGPAMDKNVLAAVSQFRYKPGTLDNQPTAVPLTLEVILHNTPQ
jgi:TonB family protein